MRLYGYGRPILSSYCCACGSLCLRRRGIQDRRRCEVVEEPAAVSATGRPIQVGLTRQLGYRFGSPQAVQLPSLTYLDLSPRITDRNARAQDARASSIESLFAE